MDRGARKRRSTGVDRGTGMKRQRMVVNREMGRKRRMGVDRATGKGGKRLGLILGQAQRGIKGTGGKVGRF